MKKIREMTTADMIAELRPSLPLLPAVEDRYLESFRARLADLLRFQRAAWLYEWATKRFPADAILDVFVGHPRHTLLVRWAPSSIKETRAVFSPLRHASRRRRTNKRGMTTTHWLTWRSFSLEIITDWTVALGREDWICSYEPTGDLQPIMKQVCRPPAPITN